MACHRHRLGILLQVDSPKQPFVDPALSAFSAECRPVLLSLRSAFRKLIAASPTPVNRATDLHRVLGVRASLAWQIFRAARADDLFACVEHIPLPDATQKLLEAARQRGFQADAILAASAAYLRFDELVLHHAGDRASFNTMISALTPGPGERADDRTDLAVRRAAFRANSQLWGLRSSLSYRCLIGDAHLPGIPLPRFIIQGSRGLRALRPARGLPVCRRTTSFTLAGDPKEFAADIASSSLLEDFCSVDLPRITTKFRGSFAHDYVSFVGVGLAANLDVFIATTFHDHPISDEPSLGVTSMIRVPTEEYIADMIVPAGTLDTASSTTRTFGCMEDVSAAETADEEYQLFHTRPATYLGTDLDALNDPAFPRCPELIRFMLRGIGMNHARYDIFRCRVRFPMLHTCIALDASRAAPSPASPSAATPKSTGTRPPPPR